MTRTFITTTTTRLSRGGRIGSLLFLLGPLVSGVGLGQAMANPYDPVLGYLVIAAGSYAVLIGLVMMIGGRESTSVTEVTRVTASGPGSARIGVPERV